MIGRLHHVIVDCPDPAALATFYAELLGLPVTWQEDDFAVVSRDDTSSGIGFQLAPGLQAPRWPDPSRPQQMHFDVMVDDVEAAESRVLALGARRLPGADSDSAVYADPAGHPFCLIPRPHWAAPIGAARVVPFGFGNPGQQRRHLGRLAFQPGQEARAIVEELVEHRGGSFSHG